MSSTINRGLCWAFTALQVAPENIRHALSSSPPAVSTTVTPEKPFHKVQADTVSSSDKLCGGDQENVRPRYSRQEVSDHCSSESCWMVINNKVYDVTRFLRMHPGGDDIILEHGGHDATSAFIDKGHSLDAYDMLAEYCIGEVIQEDWFPEKNCT